MKKSSCNIDDNVHGLSPLGGNSIEGTGSGLAEVRDTSVQGVPLFWDHRAQAYISEQAIQELDDRNISEVARAEYEKEQSFLLKAGYRKG
jgi:hypothetical protein